MTKLSGDQEITCWAARDLSVTVHSRPSWAENHKDVGALHRDIFVDGQNYI